ncbi:MAG: IS21 family transposase [Methylibium sp.]|nr:IS21 family transposase [Methylibium sp.]
MYGVELYSKVRMAVLRDGLSQREVARRFGIDRGTVAKMVGHAVPPGYRQDQPRVRPKLDAHAAFIDEILKTDLTAPKKQRHTILRLFERLRDERGFDGGYTTVRDYVRPRRLSLKEVFVPLAHPAGHAQADFGEAWAVLGGVRRKVHVLVVDLPQSDAIFLKAYHAETAEALCDGHVAAFDFFGGVPLSILYDNTKLVVAKILGDGTRKRATLFAELQSHYLFKDRFGRPGKGNDKGKVEGMVGFGRRTFMVPIPEAPDIDALNAMLLERCRARQDAVLRGADGTIGERLAADRAAFSELPPTPLDACDKQPGKVSSQALVRYKSTDYSVPVDYAHRDVLVKGYVDAVAISVGAEEIARHPRSYDSADFVFDPLHYLALLEMKVGALDQAAPLQGWALADDFPTLRRLLEARLSGKNRCAAGKREYVQVLRLLEVFPMATVHGAVVDALRLGAIGYDAVKHLALCRIERRPPKLNLDAWPYLPEATVETTSAASYMSLLTRADAGAPA